MRSGCLINSILKTAAVLVCEGKYYGRPSETFLYIGREFTSSYVARFVIEKERIVVDNSNRSCHHGNITPQNLMPQAKNPLIADFFKEIGRADELGSGVRNLYKFVRLYSGKDPMLLDEDIFTLIIPLDDTFSPESAPIPEIRTAKQRDGLLAQSILERLRQDDTLSREALASAISSSPQIVKGILNKLRQDGKLKRIGPAHGGHWVVVEE